MKNKTTFQIQFFDGRDGDWKPVRCYKHLGTLEEAKAFKKAQQELCDYMVQFRILEGDA